MHANIFYIILIIYVLTLIYNTYTYGFTGYYERRVARREARWDRVDRALGIK